MKKELTQESNRVGTPLPIGDCSRGSIKLFNYLFITLILTTLGCQSNKITQQNNLWSERLAERLDEIQEQNEEYLGLKADPKYLNAMETLESIQHLPSFRERINAYKAYETEIDHQTQELIFRKSELEREIKSAILNLWSLTGHCLYSDIPHENMLDCTTIIIERYRKFNTEQNQLSLQELKFEGIQQSIEVFKTEYFYDAVCILQEQLHLSPMIWSSSSFKYTTIALEKRLQAYEAMKEWWEQNNQNLYWVPSFQTFFITDNSLDIANSTSPSQSINNNQGSVEMPKEVVDAIFNN